MIPNPPCAPQRKSPIGIAADTPRLEQITYVGQIFGDDQLFWSLITSL